MLLRVMPMVVTTI